MPYLVFLPKFLAIREVTATTLAAQLFVLPWVLYKIGEFSIVAPLVNILITPLVPVAMLFSFLTGVIAFIGPILAYPLAFPAYGLLAYIVMVVEFFASFSWSAVTVSSTPIILVFGVYVFYLGVIIKKLSTVPLSLPKSSML